MAGLTRKQHDLLMYVNTEIREHGVPPSYVDMAEAMDLKSKSGIVRLVDALEERGYVRRIAKRARSIEIVRLPQNVVERICPAISRAEMFRHAPNKPSCDLPRSSATVNVPLVGRLAAGTPVEALQNRIADVAVDSAMLGVGDHYALEIAGDSMINAGILDGDTIIVCETDKAQTGEIIVALIDDSEVTLKRLRWRGDYIALEAANPAYETRLYGADRVRIQGNLVGLVRRY